MEETIFTILVCLAVTIPVYRSLRRGWRRQDELKRAEMYEDGREGISLSEFERPDPIMGVGVYGILLSIYRSLRKQGAAGYGCWISACIKRMQDGEDVPPETALIALRWTRDELRFLNGRRYDLNELGRGILALEVETGEWG